MEARKRTKKYQLKIYYQMTNIKKAAKISIIQSVTDYLKERVIVTINVKPAKLTVEF